MDFYDFLRQLDSSTDLEFTLIRAVIVYLYAVFLFRLNKRIHLESAFDFVLTIIIGAVLGRTIYGKESLISVLAASLLLIFLHKIFALLSFYSRKFGRIAKGESVVLYNKGKFNHNVMKHLQITREDILSICRIEMHRDELNKNEEVRLERNGHISITRHAAND